MRILFSFLFIGTLLFTFSSCKQCTECTKYPGKTQKLCKKDYATDESYTGAYHHLIADGYKCD